MSRAPRMSVGSGRSSAEASDGQKTAGSLSSLSSEYQPLVPSCRWSSPLVTDRAQEDPMLNRLTDFCYRRRRLVVVAWLVILVATAVAGSRFGGGDTTDYGTPGSESKAATSLLDERFPARSGDTIDVV